MRPILLAILVAGAARADDPVTPVPLPPIVERYLDSANIRLAGDAMAALDPSMAPRLAALAEGSDGRAAIALTLLLSADRPSALRLLQRAEAGRVPGLLAGFARSDVGEWPPSDRAVILEAARRAFPDGWTRHHSDCGNAHGDPISHSEVFAAILSCGPDAEPLLAALLEDARPMVRVNAAFVLRKALGEDRRLALLASAMHDADARVREVAAQSIELGCPSDGWTVLREWLTDGDPFVRRRVAMALATWGDVAAVPALIDSLALDATRGRAEDSPSGYESFASRVSGGPRDALRLATLRGLLEPSPPATPFGLARVEERAEWTRWWQAHERGFSLRDRILQALELPPGDAAWLLSPRILRRLDDAQVDAAVRAHPDWCYRIWSAHAPQCVPGG
jgi:hypothetical protein